MKGLHVSESRKASPFVIRSRRFSKMSWGMVKRGEGKDGCGLVYNLEDNVTPDRVAFSPQYLLRSQGMVTVLCGGAMVVQSAAK